MRFASSILRNVGCITEPIWHIDSSKVDHNGTSGYNLWQHWESPTPTSNGEYRWLTNE